MNLLTIQLIYILSAEILFVILPFMKTFRKEGRFSAAKNAGILTGYLFFVCLITMMTHEFIKASFSLYIAYGFTVMTANILLCRQMVKTDWQVTVYSLFLYKNFVDIASFCADLISASFSATSGTDYITNAKMAYYLLFLCLIVGSAYHILHTYLVEAVEYTRHLPVWKYLVSIPVLFFIVFRFHTGVVDPETFIKHHPYMMLPGVFWLACIFAVHYVSLRILSRLAQSYALREQYRTTRLLASVQTAQTATLQHNLEQLKKIRHDYRHHMITLKGFLEEGQADPALDYINEYLGSVEAISTVQYCPNLSSNSILNYYINSAQNSGVTVETSISLPETLPLPEIDFCTILGNLLSNAVEACERQKSGKPFISISIGQAGKSMIALSIRNTYDHIIRLKDGRFLSSKRDDLGTGTSSVRYITERYHGILKFTYDNGIFEASLLLNPQMK